MGTGSAAFTLVSSFGFAHILGDGVTLDPSRIAAQIVTGIGFLGAGVIFIALGYNLGGPALIISALTLVLNLILTGGFVIWVKKLALRSYTPDELASEA